MDKEKLKQYDLTASVHTFTVRSYEAPTIPQEIDLETVRTMFQPKSGSWLTRVNPNKLEYGDLLTYSQFNEVTQKLFNCLGIPQATFYRTDLRLDSYEDNFSNYYKLNLFLISLFALLIHDPNGQAIGHLLLQSKELTDIAAQNQYYETKYYNKKFQTNDEDPAKARLEFRCLKTMRIDGLPPHDFRDDLFKRLDELPKYCEALKNRCNKDLYEAYLTHFDHSGKTSLKTDCATEFLSYFNNSLTIFDRQQLEQFLALCGVAGTRAKHRATYIANEKCDIEFISKSDLSEYISRLKQAMWAFFSN